MKSVIFSILIVALLLSPLCAVWGQSTVSVVNNTKSDTTIVRYWQDGISVVYTHNADNNNWFLLVDTTVPHVRRIAVPSDVTVNDFRILHDTVYIGGHHVDGSGTQRGLLAFFDIHEMSHMPSWPPNCYYYSDKYGQGLADLEVDENIMATSIDNDEFAVAYHHTNVTTEGIAVKTFGITGGLASLQNGLNATVTRQSGSIWKMRDICYSPTTKRLMVLNDFDGGTVGGQASIVYQFQYPTLTSGPYYGFYLLNNNLHALSPFGPFSNIFIASGNNILTGLLSLYWQNALTNLDTGCELIDEIMCTNTSTPLYPTYMETNLNIPFLYGSSTPFAVDEVERVVICNQ